MKKNMLILIMAFSFLLQACSADEKSTSDIGDASTKAEQESSTNQEAAAPDKSTAEVTDVAADASEATDTATEDTSKATAADTETTADTSKESQETMAASDLILPVTVNDTGKVLIQTVSKSSQYPYNSYIITSSQGESVVVDATAMPKVDLVDINPAAIFQTHGHPDHTDTKFLMTYDVPKLLSKKGEVQTKDFRVYTIPSSHSNDTIDETNGNVIVVFEVDGLRIAHMGDIGQTKLSEDQLEELGEIDIAFMQFENSYSSMTLDNAKGFTMIEQLNPEIVIPTHYTDKALPMLEEKYGAITEVENLLEISKADLPETSLKVYRILNNHKYK